MRPYLQTPKLAKTLVLATSILASTYPNKYGGPAPPGSQPPPPPPQYSQPQYNSYQNQQQTYASQTPQQTYASQTPQHGSQTPQHGSHPLNYGYQPPSVPSYGNSPPSNSNGNNYHQQNQNHSRSHHNTFAVDMHPYNFDAPLRVEAVTGEGSEWLVSGSTVITVPDRVMLTPDVANRWGLLWSRTPMNSVHYRGSLQFKISGSGSEMLKGQGMAMWIVKENYAEVHERDNFYSKFEKVERADSVEKAEAGWDILHKTWGVDYYGYRHDFQGIGVLICEVGGQPAVQLLDSTKPGSPPPKVLGSRILNKELTLSFMRQSNGVFEFSLLVKGQVEPIGRLETGNFLGGEGNAVPQHIGFTAFSGGRELVSMGAKAAEISIRKLHIINHDEHHQSRVLGANMGSAEADLTSLVQHLDERESDPSLAENPQHTRDYLQHLEGVIQNHIDRMTDRTVMKEIQTVADRTSNLYHDVVKLKSEVRMVLGKTPEDKGLNVLGSLKFQLRDMRTSIQRREQESHDMVDKARESVQLGPSIGGLSVTERLESTKIHLEEAVSGYQYIFRLLIVIIFVCIIMLIAIFRKMKSYEKKHFL